MLRRRLTFRSVRSAVLVVAGLVLLLAGCSNKQNLGEYDFRDRTLAVVTIAPPHPEVLTDMDVDVDTSNPLGSVLSAGAEIARQVSASEVRPRLDSAAMNVDVTDRMGERTLSRTARYLRAEPLTGDGSGAAVRDSDFELELRVARYGIVADSWTSGAYFLIDADMLLLDGDTGRRIWRTHVRATDPVRSSSVGSGNQSVSSVVTAVSLARMSTPEIERALETLADFAADHLVDEFAEALDDVRG